MSADESKVVSAWRMVAAPAGVVFDLIADPARQPEWDGNDNLEWAAAGQRVRGIGDMFSMTLTGGSVRDNHVVEFEEGRLIAWKPADQGRPPAGHLWRWEVEPNGDDRCRVIHTYDWSGLEDEARFRRARATTSEWLASSIDRLAALVEGDGPADRD